MTTVYVITCGSYDDYSIYGVFSTRKQAEDFINPLNTIEDYHPLLNHPNLVPNYKYRIEEYELDELPIVLKLEDITYYWECEVTTNSSAYGRKQGEYSVTKKAIAKQDVDKLKLYKKEFDYFLCSSLISESDVVEIAYNYYQDYLKETNKYDDNFWKPVSK